MAVNDALDRYLANKFSTANGGLFGSLDPGIATTVIAGGEDIPAVYNPQPPTSSGSGGDGGGRGNPTLNWRAYLLNWGFDQPIVDELDRIFRTYTDSSQAAAAGLYYIRGTDWYAKTFPGINAGIQKGLIGNEADYRAYTTQLNEIYQRYYGRNVTGQDVSNTLSSGSAPHRVEQGLQGQAYIAANRGDLQQLSGAFGDTGQLSEKELTAYGEEQSGLDSFLGQEIQRRLAMAQQRFQGVFKGVLATPALSMTKAGRLNAPGLAGGVSPNDVAA